VRLTLTRRRFGRGVALAAALAVSAWRAVVHAGEPSTHVVLIQDFTFVPADLSIETGDVVVWKNADIAPHTATHLTGHWDTGEIAGGASASVTFEESGDHRYLCAFHPQMTGRLRVAPPS